MKKFNDTELQKALQARREAGEEVARLEARLARVGQDLASASESANLDDEKALREIVRLDTLGRVLPQRISRAQDVVSDWEQTLVAATHAFIQGQLAPAIEASIKEHKAGLAQTLGTGIFEDVEAAFRLSKRGRELAGMSAMVAVVAVPDHGAERYAESMLQNAAKL